MINNWILSEDRFVRKEVVNMPFFISLTVIKKPYLKIDFYKVLGFDLKFNVKQIWV